MFITLITIQLFMNDQLVPCNYLVKRIKLLQPRINVTTKEESNPNRLDQMVEQKTTKT